MFDNVQLSLSRFRFPRTCSYPFSQFSSNLSSKYQDTQSPLLEVIELAGLKSARMQHSTHTSAKSSATKTAQYSARKCFKKSENAQENYGLNKYLKKAPGTMCSWYLITLTFISFHIFSYIFISFHVFLVHLNTCRQDLKTCVCMKLFWSSPCSTLVLDLFVLPFPTQLDFAQHPNA